MSLSDETRRTLARMVAAGRRRLKEDVTDQLRSTFGLYPDGTILPLEQLTHLTEAQRVTAQALRELLDHFAATAAGNAQEQRRTVYERMVLEIAFTTLNRLAALRLCEERGLVIECARKGIASDGFRLFEMLARGALGTRYETYRLFLESLFDELAVDLGVLFDRTTPQSAISPSERCLEEVLTLLNDPSLTRLWTQDETIGWIYQYFNPPEERRAMREASPAPQNSRELAVRNQFFTPRYVVEFLTDNTFGRLWYEMRKGDTRLKEDCRYLVHRPDEILPHREKKDPRDLKVLDPACGSGHFLLYAYNLLEAIYQEAWEDTDSPPSEATGRRLQGDYGTPDDLRQALPGLILRHNLHGIDIDLRACQIAALALWLRAQRAYQALGLKPAERSPIKKTNIVCAEPMPGETDMLREFTASLTPKVLGQLVEVVFDKMQLAGEAGSLLKIEEEIRDTVAAAKKQWLEGPKYEQIVLFPQESRPKQEQLRLFDVSEITDEEFWIQAEEHIIEALRTYAEKAENGRTFQRRLFAEDAAQGFAFVDMCRKRFDVVLMNPPFGEASPSSLTYLAHNYPTWNNNLLCAFIQRACQMLGPLGAEGVIYDRTALVKSTYEDFRRTVLIPDNRLAAPADLGWEVLDANVEVTTIVLRHGLCHEGVFVDVRNVPTDEKGGRIEHILKGLATGDNNTTVALENGVAFQKLPNAGIGYDSPDFLRTAFGEAPSLEEIGFKANQGHALKAEKHFRVWWEVSLANSPGFLARMFNGAGFSPYSTSLHDCVVATTALEYLPKDTATVLRNKEAQMLPGVCFGKRSEYFCTHILPKGHIFTELLQI